MEKKIIVAGVAGVAGLVAVGLGVRSFLKFKANKAKEQLEAVESAIAVIEENASNSVEDAEAMAELLASMKVKRDSLKK